jgi:hypothetical protein
VNQKPNLHNAARKILHAALIAADARQAVVRALVLGNSTLKIHTTEIDLSTRPVFAIALGKAAMPMSAG